MVNPELNIQILKRFGFMIESVDSYHYVLFRNGVKVGYHYWNNEKDAWTEGPDLTDKKNLGDLVAYWLVDFDFLLIRDTNGYKVMLSKKGTPSDITITARGEDKDNPSIAFCKALLKYYEEEVK